MAETTPSTGPVTEERRMRMDNSPFGKLMEQFQNLGVDLSGPPHRGRICRLRHAPDPASSSPPSKEDLGYALPEDVPEPACPDAGPAQRARVISSSNPARRLLGRRDRNPRYTLSALVFIVLSVLCEGDSISSSPRNGGKPMLPGLRQERSQSFRFRPRHLQPQRGHLEVTAPGIRRFSFRRL